MGLCFDHPVMLAARVVLVALGLPPLQQVVPHRLEVVAELHVDEGGGKATHEGESIKSAVCVDQRGKDGGMRQCQESQGKLEGGIITCTSARRDTTKKTARMK